MSGIYRAPSDLDDEAFDRKALSFGMQDLYSYAKGIIENAAGGVWGPLYLPQISFSILLDRCHSIWIMIDWDWVIS